MRLVAPMTSRDPAETHRASTPLELFFDLTFVVAVARVASGLAQGLIAHRTGSVLVGYPLVFFAIWWAWMNFTWFASAYDTDDVAYRICVMVQMVGVLILAAGVPRALNGWDFKMMVVGYVVMRLAMVALWLRAAASDRERRQSARRYGIGVALVQIAWTGWLFLPDDAKLSVFLVLATAELAVPLWAEAAGRTSWHPGHIAERYGLFTIIVLGEVVLATSAALEAALNTKIAIGNLLAIVAGGLLIVFSMWWFYFDMPSGRIVREVRHNFGERITGAFVWGYGHYVVFTSAAAVGSGLSVAIDQVDHQSRLSHLGAGFIITVPVVVYLFTVWALHGPYKAPGRLRTFGVPVASALILGCSASPQPVFFTGVLLAALVAVSVIASQPRALATKR